MHTNNVWEDRALGPHQQQRCSNVSYARSQVRGPHNHIFVSQTIYFTLLHSLKTRLFINPVLNNPNPKSSTRWFESRCVQPSTKELTLTQTH